jgi:hypothetical protein
MGLTLMFLAQASTMLHWQQKITTEILPAKLMQIIRRRLFMFPG